jgi:hypothetical protein
MAFADVFLVLCLLFAAFAPLVTMMRRLIADQAVSAHQARGGNRACAIRRLAISVTGFPACRILPPSASG